MAEEDRRVEAAGERRLRAGWTAVWAVFVGGLIAGAYIGKVPPALPALRADFDLTLVETGYIATMLNVMGGVIGMFAGIFSDRFGHKRIALGGLALMAVGGLVGALAPGYALLLLSRFLEGAGFIMMTVAGVALIAHAVSTAERPKAMALWSCYMPAGGSLAMLAASAALAAFDWRSLWILMSVLAVGCFGFVARSVPSRASQGAVGMLRLGAESLAHPASLLLCLSFAGYVAQWAAFMTWLPTFVIVDRGGSATVGALLTALWVGINVPGVLAGGWLMARGARRSRMIVLASGLQALAATGAFLDVLPDWGRYLSCLAFSFFGGVIPTVVFSGVAALARTPQHIGTTNGMVMQASQLTQFVSPIVVAWIATRFGWGASLSVMLAFAACAAVGGLAIARIERAKMAA
ncbi:MAG: MFS transporter [Betaproteobacteria bacterium]|nr:MFS transporter [Betaproteobacteria bacterium]